jgi:hypothetical protein
MLDYTCRSTVIQVQKHNFTIFSIQRVYYLWVYNPHRLSGGCHGHDHLVVGFTTTCSISAYHHESCELKSCSWRGVLDTTLCDKVCQWFDEGRWLSLGTSVSSTNTTDIQDITELLLEMALNAIHPTIICDKVIWNIKLIGDYRL